MVMTQNIINSRELIWQLFKRDFFASYKKSFLGISWIVVSPILGIVSWVFLQKTGLLNPGQLDIPYPVYVLIGTSVWGLFIGFYSSARNTLSSGKSLVMQVNYPHEALLFKETAQHIANFTITFILNIIVLLAFRIVPSWTIIFFPLVMLPLFFLGAAIGLIISMFSIVAIDISKIVNMIMNLMLYLTPIIYSDKIDNPLVQMIIKLNPLTYLVCSARDIIIFGSLYHTAGFVVSSIGALSLFLVSWRLFYVSENKIIERMI